jgi:hypothetical protein
MTRDGYKMRYAFGVVWYHLSLKGGKFSATEFNSPNKPAMMITHPSQLRRLWEGPSIACTGGESCVCSPTLCERSTRGINFIQVNCLQFCATDVCVYIWCSEWRNCSFCCYRLPAAGARKRMLIFHLNHTRQHTQHFDFVVGSNWFARK